MKNYTYYFFDAIINIKDFYPNDIKIDEKSYKNIIYYIAYVTIKDSKYVNINSVKSFIQTKWMNTLKKLMKISI